MAAENRSILAGRIARLQVLRQIFVNDIGYGIVLDGVAAEVGTSI